jgi:hypothetical protein
MNNMISFVKMVVAAACVTATFIEISLVNKAITASILFQLWIFLEWVSNLKQYKTDGYDPVINDVLPFLVQIILFIKVIS